MSAVTYSISRFAEDVFEIVKKLLAVLFVAWLVVLGWFAYTLFAQHEAPAIAADLPKDVSFAEKVYVTRLSMAFPAGSDVAALETALGEQGFTIGSEVAQYNAQGWGAVCPTTYHVSWVSDSDRKITAINGHIYDTCF
ncbi:MAG: hypothetical protein AAGE61_04140 [Pseudomonadota bacterium]